MRCNEMLLHSSLRVNTEVKFAEKHICLCGLCGSVLLHGQGWGGGEGWAGLFKITGRPIVIDCLLSEHVFNLCEVGPSRTPSVLLEFALPTVICLFAVPDAPCPICLPARRWGCLNYRGGGGGQRAQRGTHRPKQRAPL